MRDPSFYAALDRAEHRMVQLRKLAEAEAPSVLVAQQCFLVERALHAVSLSSLTLQEDAALSLEVSDWLDRGGEGG